MTLVINALKLKEEKIEELQGRVNKCKKVYNDTPRLVIVKANDDKSSSLYVNNKVKLGEQVGIQVDVINCHKDITTEGLAEKIKELNGDNTVNSIILQLPLYDHLDKDVLIPLISVEKDCDGFSDKWLGELIQGKRNIVSCTPLGVMNILKHHNVDLVGKEVVVIGKSAHVGMPLSILMAQAGATTTIAHSKSDLETVIKRSDVVVSCVGKYDLVKAEWIKKGAIVLGVGYSISPKGKLSTDYIVDEIVELGKANMVGSVTNNTGLATVISLIENVVKLFEIQKM